VTGVELLDRNLILLSLDLKFLRLITLHLFNHLVLLFLQERNLCLISLLQLLDLALVSNFHRDESSLVLRLTNNCHIFRLNRLQLTDTFLFELLNLRVVSLDLLLKLSSVCFTLVCELGLVCLVQVQQTLVILLHQVGSVAFKLVNELREIFFIGRVPLINHLRQVPEVVRESLLLFFDSLLVY